MSWLFVSAIVIAGFLFLKVRRRRKARRAEAAQAYSESQAA